VRRVEVLSCWVYLLVKAKEEMLELPMLADYRSAGDHGLAYVPRWVEWRGEGRN
jgi:hypothetical protein